MLVRVRSDKNLLLQGPSPETAVVKTYPVPIGGFPSLDSGSCFCGKPGERRMAVKLLAADSERYVFAESVDRVTKERAMRKRQM
jgi:hypothetical protein